MDPYFLNDLGKPILREENEVYNDLYKNNGLILNNKEIIPVQSAKAIHQWWDVEVTEDNDEEETTDDTKKWMKKLFGIMPKTGQ